MTDFIKRIIPFSIAAWIIISLNILVIGFHILVLSQIIPYDIVWAGKLKSENEMYVFELISLLINLILITTVVSKMKIIKRNSSNKMIDGILWLFVIIFTLNTLGNLTAQSNIESYVATPLTFMLVLLCLRIAVEKPKNS